MTLISLILQVAVLVAAWTSDGDAVRLRSGMLLRPVQKDSTTVGVEASMDKGSKWMPFGSG
ncbi:MAG: hypothetical protein J6W09_10335, partial [Bacteroidales bacterium]|nr:hypothetical protein [Bacteroidales bacterium]